MCVKTGLLSVSVDQSMTIFLIQVVCHTVYFHTDIDTITSLYIVVNPPGMIWPEEEYSDKFEAYSEGKFRIFEYISFY